VRNAAVASRITRRNRIIARAAAFAAVLVAAASPPARAERVTPPPVPPNLAVPAGNEAFLVGHAVGTQNYVCLPSGAGFAWTFLAPQATLFKGNGEQIMTHFLSPNPEEAGTARATWQHSKDTSSVWALAIASSTDPAFVVPGGIPWLLLQMAGTQGGPTGGDRLTPTTFLHRVNTSGGIAPETGCTAAADVGKRSFVSYTADYFFYRAD
jgi:hypothetical protein